MNFWNFNELTQMHIELTNACNAACPMCVRFYNNSPLTRPDLEIGQITLEQFKKYFPPEIIQRCSLILFCGVHGDPCVARDMYEICEYIDSVNPNISVRVNTNGGMRRSIWWEKLGKLFSKHPWSSSNYWSVTFSIDGLEDTNHIYRRNVDWKILMENAESFINAGGPAIWDFLIFKHNEHQIIEAKRFSEKMGFKEFVPKKALGVDNGTELVHLVALNKEGELDYTIEAPVDPKNRNLENPTGVSPIKYYPFKIDNYRSLKETKSTGKDFQNQVLTVYEDKILKTDNTKYDGCKINCKSKVWTNGKKEIFVDNFGRVMPCCYIGTRLNGLYSEAATLQLHKHMNDYGWDKFDLNIHSLEEILSSGHLDRVFADSWSKDTIKDGKLLYCSETCGVHSSIDRIFTHEIIKENPRWAKTV